MEQISYLQTQFWADFKKTNRWKSHRIGDAIVLERTLPYINRPMLYVPEYVPGSNFSDFLTQLKVLAKRRKAIFVRLEVLKLKNSKEANLITKTFKKLLPKDSLSNQEIVSFLEKNKFIPSFEDVQPTHRQFVCLDQPDIISSFSSKGRYNVRLAMKKGVRIIKANCDQPSSQALVERFHKLYGATAKRNDFSYRSLDYLKNLCHSLQENGAIFLATHEDDDLAGIITSYYGGIGSYLYGASSNTKRNFMAPYFAQIEAMFYAKRKDCHIYDLLAIAPPSSKTHPYDGITRFKKRFGGESVEILGSYDLPTSKFFYTLFSLAEKIRRRQ